MTEFCKAQWDKVLLLVLIALFLGFLYHESHDTRDAVLMDWTKNIINTLIGTLLGLVTGYQLRKSLEHPDPKPPEEPKNG